MSKIRTAPILALIALILSTGLNSASAQEKASRCKLDVSADIMSRYVWRGMNLGGSSPSMQPNIELGFGNLAIGAWGAYSFNSAITSQETDLYLSYTLGSLVSITATDYFFPKEGSPNHYFNYRKDETGHLYELSAKFPGSQKIPLTLQVAANVYGADAKKKDGSNQYSTYVEVGYNFKVKETGCNAYLGFTPTKPDTKLGETGFYGTGPGIINVGVTATRDIKITDSFTLPVNASLITNPQSENIFLVIGISL